ncbi:MAG: amino acid adenylation domain-containing protein, partial [Acidobacteriota bacterium]
EQVATQVQAQQEAILEAQRPFDLSKPPLLRVRLLQLGENEHVLLFTMHHIVSDAWSRTVLVGEIATLYQAYCRGEISSLAELPIQYADYAQWQQDWLQGDVLEKQLSYWRGQLANFSSLELPTDHPRPARQSYRGNSLSLNLSQDMTVELKALSSKNGVTLFMTLLTVFKSLLRYYSGQEDIVVGTPIANRNRKEIEGLIGFFVNTLVLRVEISGKTSFLDALARLKEVALAAYVHQDLPFEKLVEELQPIRDMSRSPLFQVMFMLQNAITANLTLPGLTIEPFELNGKTAKFDLTLSMAETEQGLLAEVVYNIDLFDTVTIARMLKHLENLFTAITINPRQRISDLPILSETERHQLLVEWNDTAVDYPQDKCIHQLFEEQVERTPDAIALVYEQEQLTYQQLNQRANQLAHYLRREGVGPEVLVGICLERCIDMVVSILAVLKAGGAYLPIDPHYPAERIAYMLSDSQAHLLLRQEQIVGLKPGERIGQRMDSVWQVIEQEQSGNPKVELNADNLAYVIYTSGSTGEPKGVMVTHQAIGNHMRWMQTTFGFIASDRVLQKTPFSFDASVWEFYAPLLVGGQLVLAEPESHKDVAYIANTISRQEITIVQFVPSLLQMLIAAEQISECSCLRLVYCGGEPLSEELLKEFFSQSQAALINLYGPTEATIDSTYWVCQKDYNNVPIGKAIDNVETFILDSYLQPVPIGVAGELYISGMGLARGYLNRPELTAERFIPNPFSEEPGTRLYKTGDLCRYLPDGNIEYLGRTDHQVKIRGYRIELGEIEAALAQYPTIQECVVIAREDEPGNKRLVAYLIAEQQFNVSELRTYLQQRLPEYMIPAAFVKLDKLPLSPNGKVDRRALPAPPQMQLTLSSSNQAATTPVEEVVAGIWTEVLGIDQIGREDNFFELGGHSLLATQVISRVRERFHVPLELRVLFQAATIAQLSQRIEAAMLSEQGIEMPAIVAVSRDREIPLSFAQQRLWFLDQLEPNSAFYNIP